MSSACACPFALLSGEAALATLFESDFVAGAGTGTGPAADRWGDAADLAGVCDAGALEKKPSSDDCLVPALLGILVIGAASAQPTKRGNGNDWALQATWSLRGVHSSWLALGRRAASCAFRWRLKNRQRCVGDTNDGNTDSGRDESRKQL